MYSVEKTCERKRMFLGGERIFWCNIDMKYELLHLPESVCFVSCVCLCDYLCVFCLFVCVYVVCLVCLYVMGESSVR